MAAGSRDAVHDIAGLTGALLDAFSVVQLRGVCRRFGVACHGRRAQLRYRIACRLAADLQQLLPDRESARAVDRAEPLTDTPGRSSDCEASNPGSTATVAYSAACEGRDTPEFKYVGKLMDDNAAKPDRFLALSVAGQAGLSSAAVTLIRQRIHAARSVKCYTSRLRLALRILGLRGIAPFPLSRDSVELLYGVLKAAHYRTAHLYVSALRVESTLRGVPVPLAVAEYARHLRRAACRGQGGPKHSEPMTADLLLRLEVASRSDLSKRIRFYGYLLAWHLLLRGDELMVLTCGRDRIEVSPEVKSATVHISGDKTNTQGRDKARTVGCCCPSGDVGRRLCPAHAAARLLAAARKRVRPDSPAAVHRAPLLIDSRGKAYSNSTFLYWFRKDLSSVKVRIAGERGQQLWGLHTFRRGGAQALAAAGWSDTTIMAWARWESSIIAMYVADAPLLASVTFASTLAGGTGVIRELRSDTPGPCGPEQPAASSDIHFPDSQLCPEEPSTMGNDCVASRPSPPKRPRCAMPAQAGMQPTCGNPSLLTFDAGGIEVSGGTGDHLLCLGHDQLCSPATLPAGGHGTSAQPDPSLSNNEAGASSLPYLAPLCSAAALV